ncbi:hypothetical protein VMCG_07045 [Cytospora schulzeri]|uniref:MARVEL domain-containing protein n=1 Tax=Cytospora schulzeri TaxID=448051 RepID=A0A423W3T1_9PEZI|nr:hypothetical protein VMCG_07045 [Valsa malicola]
MPCMRPHDDQASSSQAAPTAQQTLPEKPAAARFSTPAHAPYQLSQQQFQPLELPKVEPYKPSKPFAVAKLVLGGFNVVFAIIALGLSLGLVSSSYAFDAFIIVIIIAATAVISILWQGAEFITIAARKTRRPIHPGAHVGVHLVLWVLCIIVVPTLSLELVYTMDDYSIEGDCADYSSSYAYEYCSYYTFPSQATASKYFQLMEAVTAFSVLMLISHFTLFVMACVETDRRRKYGRKTKVVYLVANPGGPVDGRMYYAPVPGPHQQHQQQQGSVAAAAAAPGAENGADAGSYGYYAPTVPAPVQNTATAV